jgi:ribosomal protein S18 acetylase RimI-like enzyme
MYSVVEQNLRSAMRCYAFIGNGSETRDYPGLTIASSGLNVPVFNSAMLTSHPSNLDTLITTADLHYRTRKLGWTFWVCDDMVPAGLRDRGMRTAFRSQGMSRIASPPGMYAEEIAAQVKPPAPLTFARVSTEDTRLEFAHIASIVFSLPFSTSKRIYGATGLWDSPSYGWVGYFKGKAVAIVTIVIASDAIGVYSLGTLPEYQGRGFGETLLRHAIDDARRRTGLKRSVLQSTQQGINLYLRLGYRVVTNFSIYVREGCASF